MAKIGTITVTDGAATGHATVAAVAASSPLVGRLSQVAVDALRAYSDGFGIVLIDTKNRKVHVGLDDETIRSAQADAESGAAGNTTLTMDEDGTTSTWSAAHDDGSFAELDAAIAAAKPRFSVAQILNVLEDALALRGEDAIIMVDQANKLVRVTHDTPSSIDTKGDALATDVAASAGVHLLASFVQSVGTVSGPRPFGE